MFLVKYLVFLISLTASLTYCYKDCSDLPSSCVCTSRRIKCHTSFLFKVPKFKESKSLRFIDLRFNYITFIDSYIFMNQPQLKSLYLNNNNIEAIEENSLTGLFGLEVLLLYNNYIEKIHQKAFRRLWKLRTLYLNNNRLKEIASGSFQQLFSLKNLILNKNQLKTISEDAFSEKISLRNLQLLNNELTCDCTLEWLVPLSKRIRVDAKCHGSYLSELTENDLKCNNSKIGFLQLPNDQVKIEKESVKLICRADSSEVNVYWIKEGKPLDISNRRFIFNSNGDLQILDLEISDEGFYICIISNGSVKKYAQALLTVNAHILILKQPKNIEVTEGEFAEFYCSMSGKPLANIQWKHNNIPLNRTLQRFEFYQRNQLFKITTVFKSDNGVYTCHGSNDFSNNEASAVLKVNPPTMPYFEITQKNISVYEDHEIVLECFADGSPKPQVFWYKNGYRIITNSRVYFDTYGYLKITQVRVGDSGEYTCRAENIAGNIIHKFFFSVKDVYGKLISDEFIKAEIQKARDQVNEEYQNSLNSLYDKRRPKTVSDLLALVRFPKDIKLKTLLESEEIYERALNVIFRYADNINFNLTTQRFITEERLTNLQLQRISDLSGCHRHKRRAKCNNQCLKYRSIDGTCNNIIDSRKGSANTPLKRLLPATYENGFSTPRGWNTSLLYNGYKLPPPRQVSTQLIRTNETSNDDRYSHMLMQWGQFIDHDISHTVMALSLNRFSNGIACRDSCTNDQPCFPILINNEKRPHGLGNDRKCMEFVRSAAVCGTGETSLIINKLYQREKVNQITSFIDASNVYGSNDQDAFDIKERVRKNGKLKVYLTQRHPKGMLPFNLDTNMDCQRDNTSTIGCFLAGDYRANEQLGLLAMHNLFVRHHNYLADELKSLNPLWNGEKIYQEARKIVGAQMQVITFNHWLPRIIGKKGMNMLGDYKGYNKQANPTVSNEFATAAFRFGHAIVQPYTFRLDKDFKPIKEGNLLLRDSFFSPERYFFEGALDPILRGLFGVPAKLKVAKEIMNSELTEKLFHIVRAVSQDLASLNIQRGRDHGLPDYNSYRKFCNISTANNFNDLQNEIKSREVRDLLKKIYGNVNNIDIWVGGILENNISDDTKLGPLFMCIIVDQMKSLRDADRFWYENENIFSNEQIGELKKTTLADIICENSDDIQNIQQDVFLNAKFPNEMSQCFKLKEKRLSLESWRNLNSDINNDENCRRHNF